ncbi:hypothetical protein GS640_00165 [Rhodococcus hoagii]|nr:hypothetical protein [Prescottella equi]NKR23572.1 hypothetical protein [Prescottella equi]
MRAERELDKQHERDRIAAETYRYGGPLQLPPTPVVRFASTLGAIAMLVGGVSGFAMVGALLGALSDGHWRPLATLGVVCLVSFAVVMLTFTVHVDRSGDLTDADREEIDSAIEHISLSRGDYKEYRLAEYAAALAQRIAHSPAWASNFLESHRIELNYREELRDITIHAHRLRAIYLELGEPPRGDTPQAVRARDRFDKASAPLEVIWRALVRRVAALESFTLHLAELDTQLANMEAVERATSLEDRIGNLLASAVSDEFAAAHTLSVTERSQDTSLSVEATLDALRSDIAGLTALSQSLPAQSEPS